MDPLTYILIGTITGMAGIELKDFIIRKDYVEDKTCKERRDGCNDTNTVCFNHIKADLEDIKKSLRDIKQNGSSASK